MGELELFATLISGGGSVAQVMTFAWLYMIHRDVARDRQATERRLEAIERFIWPERLGLRCGDNHNG